MAGIYIHIPFCKQKCHYCDFHFSTNFRTSTDVVDAIVSELALRNLYLEQEVIETIYFGGGTPSAISNSALSAIINAVNDNFKVIPNAEITIETNPDDLSESNLQTWKELGFNRLSIGVQSFNDAHLQYMNRAHSGKEAVEGLRRAKSIGFSNITMDLIYGIPGMTSLQWAENIQQFLDLDLPHLSAYGLTIEPQTHFGHLVQTKQLVPEQDENYNHQFQYLIGELKERGYEHYEISNFAKPNEYSKHNTGYWQGMKYLGIGPSAHSFNGLERQWNVKSNMKYVSAIQNKALPSTIEELSVHDRYNEYIMTSLRTKWGIHLNKIKEQFGVEFQNNLKMGIQGFVASGHVLKEGDTYILSATGKHLADKIASDLFLVS